MPTRTGDYGVKILKTLLSDQEIRPFLHMPLAMLLVAALSTGCTVTKHAGLLNGEPDALTLQRPGEKRALTIKDSATPAVMDQLLGCVLEVEGKRKIDAFHVSRWRVLDAGDGSMPYVGVLSRFSAGGQVAVADQQTGRLIKIHPDDSLRFSDHIGQLVLVMGYQVGADTIRVVGFRRLTP